MTAPVTRVEYAEYVVVDRNGNDARLCGDAQSALAFVRRWNDSLSLSTLYQRPYRAIERTITERVLAPAEEG